MFGVSRGGGNILVLEPEWFKVIIKLVYKAVLKDQNPIHWWSVGFCNQYLKVYGEVLNTTAWCWRV